ncbi:MAG: glycosyltransferase family 39 protein [Burkholderiales bacterium]|nr:glycosyltransferase family 39 protein [Burkholderiales bacterium]
MRTSSPYDNPRLLWSIAIAFLLVWFYMLGARTLVPTDEGRYAEMAREMLASGDWITLRLNGIKYFEKPPLQNWMNALSFAAFGLGDWQARLWTSLCGLLGIAVTGYTGARLFGRKTGISAALVLGSSFYWAAFAHINTLDMGLSGMMTLALCGLLLAQRDGAGAAEQRNGMLLCWAGMALATMSKGLIGFVLPGAVLVLYTLWTRDWGLWKRLHPGKGLLLFFAITTPWFVLIALKNPEHPHFFFIHEHLQRFTSKVHHREGAWYYFFPMLILGILPWLGLLLPGLWSGVREPDEPKPGFQPRKLLLIWAVFFFFFFSISGSKLPSYILPIFPALALLIAGRLHRPGLQSLKLSGWLFALLGLAGLLLAGKIGNFSKEAYELPLYLAAIPWVYGAALIALLGGLATVWLTPRRPEAAILSLAIAGFLAGQVVFLGHEPWGRYSAGILHVAAMQKELPPGTPIYAVGRYEQALPFYLQHTLILVEHPDEMEFGLEQQPELWLAKRADFVARWQAHQAKGEAALAILRPDIYRQLQQQGLPMRVIGLDPKRVIVAALPDSK